MSRQADIEKILNAVYTPSFLEVENESYKHSVPEGSESHFKVIIVSKQFEGLNKVKRQQGLYKVMQKFFDNGLHALSLWTYTESEWQEVKVKPESPQCSGHKKG